jgi:leucyl-tRNA synthetase
VVERYGADILRLHLLFVAPFDRNVVWDEEGIVGAQRFLQRVWRLCQGESESNATKRGGEDWSLRRAAHKTIRQVTEDIEAFKFNTAVATLMEFVNTLSDHHEAHGETPASEEATEVLIRLLAPLAPHIAEELWARRSGAFSVHQQPWPAYDPALTMDETVTLVVQVNGKVRDRIVVPAGIREEEARRLALESQPVQRSLDGRLPQRVVVVPGRLVNVVV